MRPKKHQTTGSNDLFRAPLDQIINLKHELVLLAGKIDWDWIDGEIAPLYSEHGRPGSRPASLIGLLLLKHIYGLSDVCLDRLPLHLLCSHPFRFVRAMATADDTCRNVSRLISAQATARACLRPRWSGARWLFGQRAGVRCVPVALRFSADPVVNSNMATRTELGPLV
jgi:hypothetical protein